jgi:hypothetical protein
MPWATAPAPLSFNPAGERFRQVSYGNAAEAANICLALWRYRFSCSFAAHMLVVPRWEMSIYAEYDQADSLPVGSQQLHGCRQEARHLGWPLGLPHLQVQMQLFRPCPLQMLMMQLLRPLPSLSQERLLYHLNHHQQGLCPKVIAMHLCHLISAICKCRLSLKALLVKCTMQQTG